jgi:hypothetical protein
VPAIADVTLAEGHSGTRSAHFRVTLTPASTGKVTVQYATANGMAQAGSDDVGQSGSLTFAAGQLAQTASIAVKGDRVKEGNGRIFVDLSGAMAVRLGSLHLLPWCLRPPPDIPLKQAGKEFL